MLARRFARTLGTNDFREIRKRIDAGDDHAQLIISAMIWNVARRLLPKVLYSAEDRRRNPHRWYVLQRIPCWRTEKRISYLAPVVVYPGQDEMLALTENALAALEGKREVKIY